MKVSAERSIPNENFTQIDGDTVQPLYNYISDSTTSIKKLDGQVQCIASLTGYKGTTTKIVITITLQKKILLFWDDVKTWTKTYETYYGTLSKTSDVSGGTYRFKAVYKVYSGTKSETITKYSNSIQF